MKLKTKPGIGFGALLGVLCPLTALILVSPSDGLKIVALHYVSGRLRIGQKPGGESNCPGAV
jgi:hypothetical protein